MSLIIYNICINFKFYYKSKNIARLIFHIINYFLKYYNIISLNEEKDLICLLFYLINEISSFFPFDKYSRINIYIIFIFMFIINFFYYLFYSLYLFPHFDKLNNYYYFYQLLQLKIYNYFLYDYYL